MKCNKSMSRMEKDGGIMMVYLVQRKGQAHDHQMRSLMLLQQLRRLHPSHTTAHATIYNCEYTPKSPNKKYNIMAPRG